MLSQRNFAIYTVVQEQVKEGTVPIASTISSILQPY